jgi:hypothetical protein
MISIIKKELSMGDEDFEKFFDENPGEGHHGDEINSGCHYRLMLDAISDRADTVANMYNSTTEILSCFTKDTIPPDLSTVKKMEEFLIYLMEQAKVTVDQSDYLISRIMDGFGPEDEGVGDESKPK